MLEIELDNWNKCAHHQGIWYGEKLKYLRGTRVELGAEVIQPDARWGTSNARLLHKS